MKITCQVVDRFYSLEGLRRRQGTFGLFTNGVCSAGLKPPDSSKPLAMQFVRPRNPNADPRNRSKRPLMAAVGPFEVSG